MAWGTFHKIISQSKSNQLFTQSLGEGCVMMMWEYFISKGQGNFIKLHIILNPWKTGF